jgi:hypothetical protein
MEKGEDKNNRPLLEAVTYQDNRLRKKIQWESNNKVIMVSGSTGLDPRRHA